MARTLIGRKIRERRKALGVTQAALAERLSISASYLNLIEANRRNIAGALLKRVAEELMLPVAEFDGASERRLIDDLAEIALDARIAPAKPEVAGAAELVAQHPQWAHALVVLHRGCLDREQTVLALSDRLTHDPFLADAVHSLLGSLSAIRSAAEILDTVEALEPARHKRFVSMIAADSRRLSQVAQALAAFFGKADAPARSITPAEEVDDFLFDHDNHFPALEEAAEAVPVDGAGPQSFEQARQVAEPGCRAAIAAQLDRTPFGSSAARQRAEQALLSYAAGALLMPYDDFRAAAIELRYDVDALGRRFGASFEQVCHRLVTLRKPGAEGVRFGFMRADAAGHITKRFPLPRLPLPRYGNACPLWAIYEAFQSPGATVRQLAQFPGGERYLFVARAVEKPRPAFALPRRFMSIMLACDALHAGALIYGDGLDLSHTAAATPVGQSCRVCARAECAYREEPPIIDAARAA